MTNEPNQLDVDNHDVQEEQPSVQNPENSVNSGSDQTSPEPPAPTANESDNSTNPPESGEREGSGSVANDRTPNAVPLGPKIPSVGGKSQRKDRQWRTNGRRGYPASVPSHGRGTGRGFIRQLRTPNTTSPKQNRPYPSKRYRHSRPPRHPAPIRPIHHRRPSRGGEYNSGSGSSPDRTSLFHRGNNYEFGARYDRGAHYYDYWYDGGRRSSTDGYARGNSNLEEGGRREIHRYLPDTARTSYESPNRIEVDYDYHVRSYDRTPRPLSMDDSWYWEGNPEAEYGYSSQTAEHRTKWIESRGPIEEVAPRLYGHYYDEKSGSPSTDDRHREWTSHMPEAGRREYRYSPHTAEHHRTKWGETPNPIEVAHRLYYDDRHYDQKSSSTDDRLHREGHIPEAVGREDEYLPNTAEHLTKRVFAKSMN